MDVIVVKDEKAVHPIPSSLPWVERGRVEVIVSGMENSEKLCQGFWEIMRDFLVYSMANDVDIPVWIMDVGTLLLILVFFYQNFILRKNTTRK